MCSHSSLSSAQDTNSRCRTIRHAGSRADARPLHHEEEHLICCDLYGRLRLQKAFIDACMFFEGIASCGIFCHPLRVPACPNLAYVVV